VEIRLLGGLWVRRADGGFVDPQEWKSGKNADLLRLLALRAGETVTADVVLEALWPKAAGERGKNSLRTALSQVRRMLGSESPDDYIDRRFGGLMLRDAWVDAVAFKALARESRRAFASGDHARCVASAREAEALYLDDFSAHDDGADWVEAEREELRAVYRGLIADAADAAVHLGWLRDAVEFATRSLALDSASERAARALMLGYAGLGQTERALRTFEQLRHALADELGADPSPQTLAVHRQLLAAKPDPPPTPPFVGRETELATLRSLLRTALDQAEPVFVLACGEPGAGGTRLVHEAVAGLPARYVSVSAVGSGDLVDAILSAAFPEVPGRGDEALLGALTGADRLVLHLDGLPEPASPALDRLCQLLPRLSGRVAIVATAHGSAADAAGEGVAHVRRLQLTPFTSDEVCSLTEELLAGPPTPELVDAVIEAGGCQPGPIVSTLRSWSKDGRVAATARGLVLMPALDGRPDPGTQALLVRAQNDLTALEMQVLHLAAVLGNRLRPSTLESLLSADHEDDDLDAGPAQLDRLDAAAVARLVAGTLDRLTDLAILTLEAGSYRFRHPLLRESALSWLRPSVRRRLHRLVAERASLPSADRVEHWLDAGDTPLACAAAMDAVEEAMRDHRFDDARTHLLRVCSLGDLVEADPVDRVQLFERVGDVAVTLGRRVEAQQAFSVALSVARQHQLPQALTLEVRCKTLQDDDEGWLTGQAADQALAVGGPGGLGLDGLEADRPDVDDVIPVDQDAEERLRDAVDQADRTGGEADRVRARLDLASRVYWPQRSFALSRRWAQEALTLTVDPALRARGLVVGNLAELVLGSREPGVEALEQAWADLRHRPDPAAQLLVAAFQCLAAHELGLPGFGELFEAARDLATTTSVVGGWRWLRVRVLTERGDLAAAEDAVTEPAPVAPPPTVAQLELLSEAQLRRAQGAPEQAAALLTALLNVADQTGSTVFVPEAAARLAALEAADDPAAAANRLEMIDMVAGENVFGRERCQQLLARAALRAAHGHLGGAVDGAAAATLIAHSLGLVFQCAEAHLARADYLARSGRRADARLAVEAAASIHRQAGAPRAARAAMARLSSL
jgi:DNA-binding SARP family transcriptional activator